MIKIFFCSVNFKIFEIFNDENIDKELSLTFIYFPKNSFVQVFCNICRRENDSAEREVVEPGIWETAPSGPETQAPPAPRRSPREPSQRRRNPRESLRKKKRVWSHLTRNPQKRREIIRMMMKRLTKVAQFPRPPLLPLEIYSVTSSQYKLINIYNHKWIKIWAMVLILEGDSEIGAHVKSNLCYLICLRYSIRSRAVYRITFSFMRAQHVLS